MAQQSEGSAMLQRLGIKAFFGLCGLLCGLAQTFAVGITLVHYGTSYSDPTCEVAITRGATILGVVDIACACALLLVLITAIASIACVTSTKSERAMESSAIAGAATTCGGVCLLMVLTLARMGILIWCAFLAFGNDRLNRYNSGAADFTCNRDLYKAFYIIVIIEFVGSISNVCNCCGNVASTRSTPTAPARSTGAAAGGAGGAAAASVSAEEQPPAAGATAATAPQQPAQAAPAETA